MRVLSLFTGLGAHDLGFEWAGMQIVGQCEIDPFCNEILKKWWPDVPRWRDVKDVTGESVRRECGDIDCIAGGFPCQGISVAGRGEGIGTEENPTEKSGLFWELLRVIRESRPRWTIFENSIALRSRGGDTVLSCMEKEGYTCWPLVVGAEHLGAPHRRHRVWIIGRLADAEIGRLPEGSGLREYGESRGRRELAGPDQAMAHPGSTGLEGRRGLSIRARQKESLLTCLSGYRWPARPGEAQYEWEAPRLIESGVRAAASRSTRELVECVARIRSCTDVEAEAWWQRNKVKVERRWAKEALRALGNANPPVVAEVVGKAVMATARKFDAN